ncbi:uncharacterized protein LOC109601560 isoform X2 [Aethina tumida]|uniref:uncharacterized protein LOC109601560 isoform X2 n=1 Tax=Aethina tumida TaxID=116153 RepID=UPI002149639A|nr:uncharacterized protein LOC109601560 isoform X2 [Aethina tumida]
MLHQELKNMFNTKTSVDSLNVSRNNIYSVLQGTSHQNFVQKPGFKISSEQLNSPLHKLNINNNSDIEMLATSEAVTASKSAQHEEVDNIIITQPFGTNSREKVCVYTGTVERVMNWRNIFQNQFCYFIVVGEVIALQDGSILTQKKLLMRDKTRSPILQVIYHTSTSYININNFFIGQMLRCAGVMIGPNIFNAHSIRNATDEEIETLPRQCCITDRSISHLLSI